MKWQASYELQLSKTAVLPDGWKLTSLQRQHAKHASLIDVSSSAVNGLRSAAKAQVLHDMQTLKAARLWLAMLPANEMTAL